MLYCYHYEKQKRGQNLCHHAASNGKLGCLDVLIKAKCNYDATDSVRKIHTHSRHTRS